MRTVISMAVAIAGLSAVPVTSVLAEHRDATQNAALQYWRALLLVPAHPRHTVWEVASYSPLTATLGDAEFLLGKSGLSSVGQSSLEDLRRGAGMPYCEWALSFQGNPHDVLLHHTQRAPTAIGLLLLSSRLNYSQGRVKDAISDLTAAWTFARHLAADGTLMTWQMHFYYIDKIAPLASCWVPQLEESAAGQLQEDLRQLPTPTPFAVILRKDRQRFLDFLTGVAEQNKIESIRDELIRLASGDEDKKTIRKVETVEKALQWIADASKMLDRAVVIATLPLDQFEPAAARFQSEASAGNPLTRSLFGLFWREPKLLTFRFLEAESTTRLAMFEAAVALRLHGRGAFTAVRDPFGNGPFEFQSTEGGYTLTSNLVIDGEPFVITFGRDALPQAKKKSQLLVYDGGADSALEIEKALSQARREKKRVLLQWGFNGCAPCYRLHRMFEDNDRLAALLRERNVRLAVDVTNDKNDVLAEKYGVEFPGVPQLTVLDIDGSAIVNARASDEFYVHRELDAAFAKKLRRLLGDSIRLWRRCGDFSAATYASRRQRLAVRLQELVDTACKDGQAKRLIKRLRRHQDDLFTFLGQEDVPFDNNAAERAIRPAVILRKNSYGNRSQRGTDCQAVLMLIFRTLKQRGHDPIQVVVTALATYLTTSQFPSLPKPQTTSYR